MVKHSIGEGDYSGDGGSGEVESTLTGIYPYAAYGRERTRLRAWAAAGLGEGTLTLTPKNPETGADDPALETDMSLGMAALGARGNLVAPAGGSGFRLDLESGRVLGADRLGRAAERGRQSGRRRRPM